ncbi:MAG: PAS domain S-box protein [Euryarchaeota archaeon]|nr:PAS domain S-box protein [Euryarchaeota archaeon]
MESYQKEIALIQQILKENPKGMTVTDVSRKIKINRNSVAKYLDIMRVSGHVEMITFGPAKVFFPSKRVPLVDILNYTSDYVLVFDENFKITMINDAFLDFMKNEREEILGQKIPEFFPSFLKDDGEVLIGMKEALQGRNFSKDLDLEGKGYRFYFSIRIMPTTFEDGRNGATLIIKNITQHKLAELALKGNQDNFRDMIKKGIKSKL